MAYGVVDSVRSLWRVRRRPGAPGQADEERPGLGGDHRQLAGELNHQPGTVMEGVAGGRGVAGDGAVRGGDEVGAGGPGGGGGAVVVVGVATATWWVLLVAAGVRRRHRRRRPRARRCPPTTTPPPPGLRSAADSDPSDLRWPTSVPAVAGHGPPGWRMPAWPGVSESPRARPSSPPSASAGPSRGRASVVGHGPGAAGRRLSRGCRGPDAAVLRNQAGAGRGGSLARRRGADPDVHHVGRRRRRRRCRARRRARPRPPAATMVVVAGLLDPAWKVEIEAEAVLPPQ